MKKERAADFRKILLAATFAVMMSPTDVFASEYSSLYDAINSTTTPRTYTLDDTEIMTTTLGTYHKRMAMVTGHQRKP